MRDLRDDLAVAVLADHDRHVLASLVPEERQQLAMPQREQHALAGAARLGEGLPLEPLPPPGAGEPANQQDTQSHDPTNLAVVAHRTAGPAAAEVRPARSSAMRATRSAAPGWPSMSRTAASCATISARRTLAGSRSGWSASATRAGTSASCTNS